MKKYLLIMKRKSLITYEVYTSYNDMLKEAVFLKDCLGDELTYKYYQIDNMDLNKIGDILLTFTNFLKEQTYGK